MPIALSGYAMARDIAAGRLAGFDYYLPKPADINELLALFPQP
jgi:CheY-like chemotaxis protein